MKLKQREYDALCLNDRLQLTWTVGTFLNATIIGNSHYMLYSLFDYYVELSGTFDRRDGFMHAAVAFHDGHWLDKHLEIVNWKTLLHAV